MEANFASTAAVEDPRKARQRGLAVAIGWSEPGQGPGDARAKQRVGLWRARHNRNATALYEALAPIRERTIEHDDRPIRTIDPVPGEPVLPEHPRPAVESLCIRP